MTFNDPNVSKVQHLVLVPRVTTSNTHCVVLQTLQCQPSLDPPESPRVFFTVHTWDGKSNEKSKFWICPPNSTRLKYSTPIVKTIIIWNLSLHLQIMANNYIAIFSLMLKVKFDKKIKICLQILRKLRLWSCFHDFCSYGKFNVNEI